CVVDRPRHGCVVRAHAARFAQHCVAGVAGRQLHALEDRLGIAAHVGRQRHVALYLRLDAPELVGFGAGACCSFRLGHFLLRIAGGAFALGLRLQVGCLARLALARFLLVLFFLLGFALLGFLLFALLALVLGGFLCLALLFSLRLAGDIGRARIGLLHFWLGFWHCFRRRRGLRLRDRRRRFRLAVGRRWRRRRFGDCHFGRRRIELRRHRCRLPVLPPDREEEDADKDDVDENRQQQRGPAARSRCRCPRPIAGHAATRGRTRQQPAPFF